MGELKTKIFSVLFMISVFLVFPFNLSCAEDWLEEQTELIEDETPKNIDDPIDEGAPPPESAVSTVGMAEQPSIDEIGMVAATMNSVLLHRGNKPAEIVMADKIQVRDAFETGEWSKLKILLIDGSTVTLDSNTKISLDDFIYNEASGGKTSLTLYVGYMRLIAGRTIIEAATDEVVVSVEKGSAEIFAGLENQRPFTGVACLDGKVTVSGKGPESAVVLGKNQILTVLGGEPMMDPLSLPATGLRAMGKEEISQLEELRRIESIDKDIEKAVLFETAIPSFEQEPGASTSVTIKVEYQ